MRLIRPVGVNERNRSGLGIISFVVGPSRPAKGKMLEEVRAGHVEARALKNALRDEGPQQSSELKGREPLYQQLRPGPGQSAKAVAANQRARLCGAMVELVAARGYGGVTVRELSRLAGVSTKTFYDCFANVDDCFAATQARIIRDALGPAQLGLEDDESRLRARVRDLFLGLGADPKAAHLVLVESLAAGPEAGAGINSLSRALERLVRDEFATRSRPVLLRPALASGIASAALRVVRACSERDRDGLEGAADRFSDWLLAVRDPRLVRRRGHPEGHLGTPRVSSPPPRRRTKDERELLLSAVLKLCALDGYEGLTVPAIRREASVSRRCFDASFEGVEDCFLAAVETRLEAAARRAMHQAGCAPSWESGVVRAVGSLASDFVRDPSLARIGLVDILAPGRAGLELREGIVGRWASRLRRGAPSGLVFDELGAEASVAAAWGIAEAEAAAGPSGRIRAEVPSMAFLALAPAIGPDAADAAISAALRLSPRKSGVIKHLA